MRLPWTGMRIMRLVAYGLYPLEREREPRIEHLTSTDDTLQQLEVSESVKNPIADQDLSHAGQSADMP